MAPHKDSDRGTFIIDRRIPGVGRLKRASGTTHVPTHRAINAMLDTLYSRGRIDLLRALRDGALTFLETLDAFTKNRLETLATTETVRPLRKAMDTWLEELKRIGGEGASKSSVANHKQHIRYLHNTKGADKLTIQQLPDRLSDLRREMQDRAATFNKVRSTAQAFVRDTLGTNNAIYRAVSGVRSLKAKKKREANPQTVPQLIHLTSGMPLPWSKVAIQMAVSGMGPKEYNEDGWEPGIDRVFIHGVKREGREREVPLVWKHVMMEGSLKPDGMSAERAERLLNRALRFANMPEGLSEEEKKAYHSGVRAYDLRHSFSNYMEAAGIPRTRRRLYMGHASRDVLDDYEAHQVTAFLLEDAKLLEGYLNNAKQENDVLSIGGSTTIKRVETA